MSGFPLLPAPAPNTADPANFATAADGFFSGMAAWASAVADYLDDYQVQLDGTGISNVTAVSGGVSARMWSGANEIVELPNVRAGGVAAGSALRTELDGKLDKSGGVMSGFLEVTDGTNGVVIGGPVGFIEVTRSDGGAGIDLKSSAAEDRDIRLQAGGDGLNIVTGGDSAPTQKVRVGATGEAALTLYRQNSTDEGGQLDLTKALDNSVAWSIDVIGNGSSNNHLRFINQQGPRTDGAFLENGRFIPYQGVQFSDGSLQNAAGLGFGQTWQDFAASRVANTSYQNTTGRPIELSIRANALGAGRDIEISTNGTSWSAVTSSGGNETCTMQAIVPVGNFYRFTSTFLFWKELR